jgi:hypothetical protein
MIVKSTSIAGSLKRIPKLRTSAALLPRASTLYQVTLTILNGTATTCVVVAVLVAVWVAVLVTVSEPVSVLVSEVETVDVADVVDVAVAVEDLLSVTVEVSVPTDEVENVTVADVVAVLVFVSTDPSFTVVTVSGPLSHAPIASSAKIPMTFFICFSPVDCNELLRKPSAESVLR